MCYHKYVILMENYSLILVITLILYMNSGETCYSVLRITQNYMQPHKSVDCVVCVCVCVYIYIYIYISDFFIKLNFSLNFILLKNVHVLN